MDKFKGLCIGGPLAGTYRTSEGSHLISPVVNPVPTTLVTDENPMDKEREVFIYTRVYCQVDQGEPVQFWASELTTFQHIMAVLIQAYEEKVQRGHAYNKHRDTCA